MVQEFYARLETIKEFTSKIQDSDLAEFVEKECQLRTKLLQEGIALLTHLGFQSRHFLSLIALKKHIEHLCILADQSPYAKENPELKETYIFRYEALQENYQKALMADKDTVNDHLDTLWLGCNGFLEWYEYKANHTWPLLAKEPLNPLLKLYKKMGSLINSATRPLVELQALAESATHSTPDSCIVCAGAWHTAHLCFMLKKHGSTIVASHGDRKNNQTQALHLQEMLIT
jgi:hypothetical protein